MLEPAAQGTPTEDSSKVPETLTITAVEEDNIPEVNPETTDLEYVTSLAQKGHPLLSVLVGRISRNVMST